jgi:hypothetical protein
MSRNLKTILFVVIAFWLVSASDTDARRIVVNVGASDLSTYAPGGSLGSYYVLEIQPPQELTAANVELAILEFYVDAASMEKDGYQEDTPVIELYALKNEFTGSVDPNQFVLDPRPVTHNVAVGINRRMMIDVTEIVRSYLKDPTTNHGLIIGSLTGEREGLFSIKSDVLDQGAWRG